MKSNQLFLVRKMPMTTNSKDNSKLSRAETEALLERMLAMQLKETEEMADVDEDGLECIDLTDDIGATTSGLTSVGKPQPAAASTGMMFMEKEQEASKEEPTEPEQLFRKTKSNNFFAMDDSLD